MKDVVAGEFAVLLVIDLRKRVCELLHPHHSRETIEPGEGGHPPLSGVVLESDLVLTPAETLDLAGYLRPDGIESLAVEMIDEGLGVISHAEFAALVFKDGSDAGLA